MSQVVENDVPTKTQAMHQMPSMNNPMTNKSMGITPGKPKSRGPSSGLSNAGRNVMAGSYGGGAMGLQNKNVHNDPQGMISEKQSAMNQSMYQPPDIEKIMEESKYRMQQMNKPQKQGRMFGLSLGQDDGPFKQKEINGCPQIDKFATYSINSIARGRTSPRIGILGLSTYPADPIEMTSEMAQRTGGQSQFGGASQGNVSVKSQGLGSQFATSAMMIDDVSSSVHKQIKDLEVSLVTGYDMLQLFKEEADQIRKEIDVMMNVLVEKTEVVQDELHKEIRVDYKSLKSAIKGQRDENEILYKGLKQTLKDTESQKIKINVFQAKIEELEQHVGILANSPDERFTTAPVPEEAEPPMTGGDTRPKLLDNSGQLLEKQYADRHSNDITSGGKDHEGLEDHEVAHLQGAIMNTEKISHQQKSALDGAINSMGVIQQMGGTEKLNSPMVLEEINTDDGRNKPQML